MGSKDDIDKHSLIYWCIYDFCQCGGGIMPVLRFLVTSVVAYMIASKSYDFPNLLRHRRLQT